MKTGPEKEKEIEIERERDREIDTEKERKKIFRPCRKSLLNPLTSKPKAIMPILRTHRHIRHSKTSERSSRFRLSNKSNQTPVSKAKPRSNSMKNFRTSNLPCRRPFSRYHSIYILSCSTWPKISTSWYPSLRTPYTVGFRHRHGWT